jgi:YD repeat-containing protein
VLTTGSPIQTRAYDPMGNTQAIGSQAYTYNGYGRMITAPNATYAYNAQGQRTLKTVSGGQVDFQYDPDGRLLFEHAGCPRPKGPSRGLSNYQGLPGIHGSQKHTSGEGGCRLAGHPDWRCQGLHRRGGRRPF